MSAPYMPFFIADYLADTAHLSTAEHGAYLLLIMNYWQRGKPLPADDRKLARIARMSDDEWMDAREALSEFFVDADGVWTHKRIDAELAVAAEKSAKAKASARASVNVRKANAERTLNERSTNAELLGEERIDTSSANASDVPRDERASSDWPSDYVEQFWSECPNKVGKEACRRKLDQLRKRRDLPWDRFFGGWQRYLAKTDDRPWCNPLTWLNQGRWDDAPADQRARGSPSQASFDSIDPDAIVARLKARHAQSETVQ